MSAGSPTVSNTATSASVATSCPCRCAPSGLPTLNPSQNAVVRKLLNTSVKAFWPSIANAKHPTPMGKADARNGAVLRNNDAYSYLCEIPSSRVLPGLTSCGVEASRDSARVWRSGIGNTTCE